MSITDEILIAIQYGIDKALTPYKNQEQTGVFKEIVDGKYKVLGLCSVKDPTTREWFEAVMYQETELGGEVYVREKTDFIDKFIES